MSTARTREAAGAKEMSMRVLCGIAVVLAGSMALSAQQVVTPDKIGRAHI